MASQPVGIPATASAVAAARARLQEREGRGGLVRPGVDGRGLGQWRGERCGSRDRDGEQEQFSLHE